MKQEAKLVYLLKCLQKTPPPARSLACMDVHWDHHVRLESHSLDDALRCLEDCFIGGSEGQLYLEALTASLLSACKMDGWIDGWMDGLMDGLMDGWMDGWMDSDGWMHSCSPREMVEHLYTVYI